MQRGFSELRSEVGRTHERVDDVMRDRSRYGNSHHGGQHEENS
jgi:hypothetical protein